MHTSEENGIANDTVSFFSDRFEPPHEEEEKDIILAVW